MNPKGHSSQVFPHIMDMSIHLDMDLRNRSCQPCTSDHPLGPQCCGMCGFWENLRYKNVDRQPWVAPCNIRDVSHTQNSALHSSLPFQSLVTCNMRSHLGICPPMPWSHHTHQLVQMLAMHYQARECNQRWCKASVHLG